MSLLALTSLAPRPAGEGSPRRLYCGGAGVARHWWRGARGGKAGGSWRGCDVWVTNGGGHDSHASCTDNTRLLEQTTTQETLVTSNDTAVTRRRRGNKQRDKQDRKERTHEEAEKDEEQTETLRHSATLSSAAPRGQPQGLATRALPLPPPSTTPALRCPAPRRHCPASPRLHSTSHHPPADAARPSSSPMCPPSRHSPPMTDPHTPGAAWVIVRPGECQVRSGQISSRQPRS